MLAATAAVPTMRTPAMAAAVTSDVRLVNDRADRVRSVGSTDGVEVMCTTVRKAAPAGGKTKANVG